MKKTLAFLFSLIVSVSMLCSSVFAKDVDITGEWYADMFGMTITMVLTDTEYSVDFAGEVEEGTYTFDGKALIMDEGTETESQLDYDAEKNSFGMDMGDGMVFEFTREKAEPFTPAEARTDSKIEEFAGDWEATMVSMFEMCLPTEMAGVSMKVTVEEENVTISIDMDGELNEFTLKGSLEEGVLTVIEVGTEGADDVAYKLQLLEDGTMASTFDMFGESATFYMEKVLPEDAEEAE